jgi:hypothetical protein
MLKALILIVMLVVIFVVLGAAPLGPIEDKPKRTTNSSLESVPHSTRCRKSNS